MLFRNIKNEFNYILWLRDRIKQLNFGVSRKVKTDSTTDFELLTRKLKSYNQEYDFALSEFITLFKRNDDLLEKTDNNGQESGTLRIRDSYSCWQKEEENKNDKKKNSGRSDGRGQKQRRLRI